MKKRHSVLALGAVGVLALGVWQIQKSRTRPLPRAALSIAAVEKQRSFPQLLTRSLGASALA